MSRGFSAIVIVLLVLLFLSVVVVLFTIKPKVSNQMTNNFPVATKTPAPSDNTQLANPASVNCTKQGGTLSIQTQPSGGQYGLCTFEDNGQCEEWALFYGNCPVGGVNTIGYDTPAQVYCAILGGETLAVADANCKLPSGNTCNDEDLFNGKCAIN